jgi:hypothetical protein
MMSTIAPAPLILPVSHMLSSARAQAGDAKFSRGERLWVCNEPPTPQRLRLLFLVNRSTQHADETNRRD